MFHDVWEKITDRYRMTFKPALRNLLASKTYFVGMLLVMTVLQALLCVICIAGVSNVTEQSILLSLLKDRFGETDTAAGALSEQVKIISDNTVILVGALAIWWLCAMTVYYQLAATSARRNKALWGLYITFGAGKKKVRRMLSAELYLVLLLGTVLGYPIGCLVCRAAAPVTVRPVAVLLAAVIALVSMRVCIGMETRLITARSCMGLMTDGGSVHRISPPRHSGRMRRGFSVLKYGTTAFLRQRRTYLSVALLAAVPVVVWICCSTASVSESAALQASELHEFTVCPTRGMDAAQVADMISDISGYTGVTRATAVAAGTADSLGTHLMLTEEQAGAKGEMYALPSLWADGRATLVCRGDPAAEVHTGFSVERLPDGDSVLIMPDPGAYTFPWGSDAVTQSSVGEHAYVYPYVYAARAATVGARTLGGSTADRLRAQLSVSGIDYIPLRLRAVYRGESRVISKNAYAYVTKPYFILSPEDYTRVTGISPEAYAETLDTARLRYDMTRYTDGSFDVILSGGLTGEAPRPGDCIQLENADGSVYTGSLPVTATVAGRYRVQETGAGAYIDEKTVRDALRFSQLYILDVREQGGDTVLHVAPRGQVLLHTFKIDMLAYEWYLVLGTPPVASAAGDMLINLYVAATYDKPFTVTYGGFVPESGTVIRLYRTTAREAADVNTHLLVWDGDLSDTAEAVRVGRYATNGFTLACADSLTAGGLGGHVIARGSGQAVVVMPPSEADRWHVSVGDKLKLAAVRPSLSLTDDPRLQEPVFRLQRQLEASGYLYSYLIPTVAEVRVSTDVTAVTLFIDPALYEQAVGRKRPYTAVDVYISSDLSVEAYDTLRTDLSRLCRATAQEDDSVHMIIRHAYVDMTLRRAADYSTWLRVICLFLPLLIFPVWFYPQSTLYGGRREEFITLFLLGRPKRTIRRIFAVEAVLTALTAVAGVLLICPVGMLIFDFFVFLFSLPISFSPAALDRAALAQGCIAAALCAVGTVFMGYLSVKGGMKYACSERR